MEKMSFEQMENLQGGISLSCTLGLIGLGCAFVGLVTVTGGGAALAAACIGYSIAPTAAALSCMEDLKNL